jgi:hypothetical protein
VDSSETALSAHKDYRVLFGKILHFGASRCKVLFVHAIGLCPISELELSSIYQVHRKDSHANVLLHRIHAFFQDRVESDTEVMSGVEDRPWRFFPRVGHDFQFRLETSKVSLSDHLSVTLIIRS